VLTVIAAAAPDPAPWWATYLTPAAVLLGVVVGALLGPLVEPWKLGAAHRAHIRQERLAQCARLIEAANETRGWWSTIMRLRLDTGKSEAVIQESVDQLAATLEEQRSKLASAVGLLDLYGPDELGNAAKVIEAADGQAVEANLESGLTVEKCRTLSGNMEAAIDGFVKIAKKYVR
jgi:hypothetical protein